MLVIQGTLVWLVLPLLNVLMRGALRISGIDGLNQTSIFELAKSPLAVLAVLGFALVATVFVVLELATFAVIGHLAFEGARVSVRSVLKRLWATARKVLTWQGLILSLYLWILLPLSHVGVSSVLTTHIAIPKFISGELMKTTTGAILYWATIALIVYVALRFSLALATLTREGTTVLSSLASSFHATRQLQFPIAAVFLSAGVAASAVMLIVVLFGAGVVALLPNDTTATLMLTLAQEARFAVVGVTAAVLAFFLVALVGVGLVPQTPADATDEASDPLPLAATPAPPAEHAAATTRSFAVFVIVTALIIAVPRVASTSVNAHAAGLAAETLVIGHRGYPSEAVENSLEGLRAAAEAGADLVELDIQETRDGGFVVIHDTSLRRLANDPRNVYELTTTDAAGVQLHQNGFISTIPTLEAFIAEAREVGVRLLVEVKPHGHEAPGFAENIVETMNKLDPTHEHILQSLDLELILTIADLDPLRETAYVIGFHLGGLPQAAVNAIVIEDWSYSSNMQVVAHKQGQGVFVWTINDEQRIRHYLDLGVDGLITDKVSTATRLRAEAAANINPVARYLRTGMQLIAIG